MTSEEVRHVFADADESGELLPADWIDAARGLASRFPDAGLRPALLLRAPWLAQRANPQGTCRVWLCLENLQVTGSFKVRGALSAMATARDEGRSVVVAASAGNHGAGVAHAAQVLGMEAVIAVPEGAPERKLREMRKAGVKIERVPGGYDHAEVHAKRLAKQRSLPFISPYDDVRVAAGNGGSLGFEIVAALGRVPEHVVAPIGGGGLASGLAYAMAREAGEVPGRTKRVWTAQSACSPAFAYSLESKRAVEALEPNGPTLAEGLEGGISLGGFARVAPVVAGVSVVSEREIASAMNQLWQTLGIRVEGSAAAALVPVIAECPKPSFNGDLVVVLTGRNVDEDVFRRVADGAGPC